MNRQSIQLLFLCLSLLLLSACSDQTKEEEGKQGEGRETQGQQGTSDGSQESPGGSATPVAEDRLIVPGERIGKTHIGESIEEANKVLGRADSSDAGMGHVWEHRRSASDSTHELDIHATFDEEGTGHYIRHIRITSPWFTTEEKLGSGSSFADVKYVYPDIQPIAEYEVQGIMQMVYDDPREGIGFEFALGKDGNPTACTGVIVHEPGRGIETMYTTRQKYREVGKK